MAVRCLTGEVAGSQVLTPSTAQVPLEYISPTSPNLLTIQRTDGLGRLYYHTVLDVNRPVEDVQPLDSGMQIERVYCKSALSEVTRMPRSRRWQRAQVQVRAVLQLPPCSWMPIKPSPPS